MARGAWTQDHRVMQTPTATTGVTVRPAAASDVDACARIFYDAFESIATAHNLPIEPPSREFSHFRVSEMLSHDGFASLVAEQDGELVGGAFIDERATIAGIGPVVVDPSAQDDGVGRALMEAAIERTRDRAGVRLVQTAYHYRSLALYAKLGFAVREPLSVLQGPPPAISVPGRGVRPAVEHDVLACDALCRRVHGHDRSWELRDAIAAGTARVVECEAGISGYATGFGYGWHAVAEANDDLIALLASAEMFMGLGFLMPSRNAELLRWCLEHGMRIVQQSTLMTIGLYSEPTGMYLPSILF
jgi:GNAT superfamily N-acetyltransferase